MFATTFQRTPFTFRKALLLVAAAWAAACGGDGPSTVAKDGYRATLAFSSDDRYAVAVRGESKRVEGDIEGSRLVKIVRPDLGKVWQFRPDTEKVLETPWNRTEEIVPGYPLEPGFDPAAYAERFGGQIEQIADATHGLHPAERHSMILPSGDAVVVWVARDLDRLVVRVEHTKKDGNDEYQPFTDTQLLDVKVGAKPDLFEPPKGFHPVKSYEELSRK
ncbi:MAG: hypothetical protein H7X85_01215 [Thermoanaerobaculia bacterium]|nr:hypothetical protein [Thermoanaerobaculia bacterium]